MKAILVLVIVLLAAAPALADVGTPAERPTETAEVLAISAGAMSALLSIGRVATGTPSYLTGGLSVGLGTAALLLTTVDNPAHETGLYVSGVAAIATGLITMRYRYVLNHQDSHARLEPTWNDGGPAMALVIDF